ncbi:MAG: MEMO1 family protein [Candidatus Syntropharchaeia archaeon]
MRKPAVAGQFYPGNPKELEEMLRYCFSDVVFEKEPVFGGVVPHAGYVYSGRVAAHVFSKLPEAETFVILGPNHHGIGSMVALSTERWRTPLGEVDVDHEFIELLPKRIIDTDETAHRYEHSIEVQIPFIQYMFSSFKIVPICMGMQDRETARDIGNELFEAISNYDRKVVFLASSDFTHYEPDEVARENDKYAIEPIIRLDVAEFYTRIYKRNVSACGVGPIASVMETVKKLGAGGGKLVKYETSGDVTGDRSSVVGYAGIVFV